MELVIYNPTEEQLLESYIISFNNEEIKQELSARLEKYNGLVYGDDSIKEAKTDRATLNKFKEAIENKRKEIKKSCMKPYEEFEAKIKEIVAMIDKPILAIDTQVKNYEQLKKDEKLEGIKAVYADRVGNLAKLIPLEKIFNQKWLNATYKGTEIEKEIRELFARVENDLQVIGELGSEYELQIKDTYLKNLDLTVALQEKKRLEEQAAKLAEHKRLQTEKAQREKELREKEQSPIVIPTPAPTPEPVVAKIEPVPEPKLVEKVYAVDFRVWATAEQLKGLQQFFMTSGIKYGKPEAERKAV